MCDSGPEYDLLIKKTMEAEFGPVELLSDPRFLIGRWKGRFLSGKVSIKQFDSDGTCRAWVDDDTQGEIEGAIETWALDYDDLWRVYRLNQDGFILANDDASIARKYERCHDR
jgi:hypothetical protein